MHFALSEEHLELASTVRSLLARHADSVAVRAAMVSEAGYDGRLWRLLAEEVGAAALAIPEEYGGAGFSSFETQIVLEQLGASLAPSPLLGSAVVAADALLLAADDEACARLLPGIADGTSIATVAWADATGRWRTNGSGIRATPGEPWRLTGEATLVLDGANADVVLAIAETDDGVGIFEVLGDGVTRVATPALDPTLRFATLTFSDAAARPLLLDAAAAVAGLRDRAITAVSALQVGAAQRGLDMTVAYSQQRVQFGRAIGSFQALKHRMADMLLQVETARTVSWAAGWSASVDAADLPERAALAKAWCTTALDHVAAETVQLHGGIAITWEHDAQLLFKRANALGQLFGDAGEHRRRFGELRGLG